VVVVMEKTNQSLKEFFLVVDFTFPNNKAVPPLFVQSREIFSVSMLVSTYFFKPIVGIVFWFSLPMSTLMAMPKTTINKYNFFSTDKGNVRSTLNVFSVKSIACKTKGSQRLTNY